MPLTSLTKIPQIMRHANLNWSKAPTLMEKWFNGPATIRPNYEPPDTSTITIDWILGFPRAKTVYDKMVREHVWINSPAKVQIEELMRRKGYLIEASNSFNDLGLSTQRVAGDSIQFRPVEYDPNLVIDELVGALGRFTFKILIAGSIMPTSPPLIEGHEVKINEVGVFVVDSYDFEGFQPLGCWNEATNSVRLDSAVGWEPVFNETFRNYRTANGRGGDYLIFSDIKRIPLGVPDTFIIPLA